MKVNVLMSQAKEQSGFSDENDNSSLMRIATLISSRILSQFDVTGSNLFNNMRLEEPRSPVALHNSCDEHHNTLRNRLLSALLFPVCP